MAVDAKGRVVLPKEARRRLGLRKGSKLKVQVEGRKMLIYPPVQAEDFIREMEGFVSEVIPESPLEVKSIWSRKPDDMHR